MSIFGDMHKRIKGNSVRKEDDRTSIVKDFVDSHGIESFNISNDQTEWYLDVDGDVHIFPQDICSDGTLGFKLVNVSGNLISHCRCISPAIVPTNLGGNIIFDVESLMDKQPAVPSPAVSSPTQQSAGDSTGMEFLATAPDQETIKKNILSLIVDADEEITLEDLQEILKEAKVQRNIQYHIEIKGENKGNKRDPRYQVDFNVIDNFGNEYPIRLETIQTAIYLTFLYLDKSIFLVDFINESDKPNNIFQKIYRSLYNNKGTVDSISCDPNKDDEKKVSSVQATLNQQISKITKKIADALPNDNAARQFVISHKEKEQFYSIIGSNQEIRDEIKKYFSLK